MWYVGMHVCSTNLKLLRTELVPWPRDDVEPCLRQDLAEHFILVAETEVYNVSVLKEGLSRNSGA